MAMHSLMSVSASLDRERQGCVQKQERLCESTSCTLAFAQVVFVQVAIAQVAIAQVAFAQVAFAQVAHCRDGQQVNCKCFTKLVTGDWRW